MHSKTCKPRSRFRLKIVNVKKRSESSSKRYDNLSKKLRENTTQKDGKLMRVIGGEIVEKYPKIRQKLVRKSSKMPEKSTKSGRENVKNSQWTVTYFRQIARKRPGIEKIGTEFVKKLSKNSQKFNLMDYFDMRYSNQFIAGIFTGGITGLSTPGCKTGLIGTWFRVTDPWWWTRGP